MRKIGILLLTIFLAVGLSFAQTSTKKTDHKAATKSDTAKADTAKSGKTAPAGKMDINSASKDDLEKLPGIGPATSQKIIDGRPYKTKRDLLTKKIVSQSEYDKISDHIIAHQETAGGASTKPKTKATPKK